METPPDDQDGDLWDFLETNEEFYNHVCQYYGQNPDDSIIVHEQGGAASSDDEAGAGAGGG